MPPGQHRHHSIMPFLVAASGIALFSVMDAVMKSASLAVGAYNAMLYRSAFGVLLMLPLWKYTGGRWPAGPAQSAAGQAPRRSGRNAGHGLTGARG